MCTYLFHLLGQIDINELNAMSPHQIRAGQSTPAETQFSIYTDQSGMIGMLQHLHNQGLAVLLIVRQPEE